VEGPLQVVLYLIAFGAVAGGGLYYAAHILYISDERRHKPGKK
jgi:hypothetical protein